LTLNSDSLSLGTGAELFTRTRTTRAGTGFSSPAETVEATAEAGLTTTTGALAPVDCVPAGATKGGSATKLPEWVVTAETGQYRVLEAVQRPSREKSDLP